MAIIYAHVAIEWESPRSEEINPFSLTVSTDVHNRITFTKNVTYAESLTLSSDTFDLAEQMPVFMVLEEPTRSRLLEIGKATRGLSPMICLILNSI